MSLDLSATFDTIDRDILLVSLSYWFGIHGITVKCLKSFLSHSFWIKCDKIFLCCTAPYALSPRLCSQHSTFQPLCHHLSSVISSLSLNLYADDHDTQLFFISSHPLNYDSSVTRVQNALEYISSWMTASLLTLTSSKTEFLLIGNKQQLTKIHNISLNTIHSAHNLGFIFDERLTLSDQISTLSKSCYSHISEIIVFVGNLDLKTASTIATFTGLSKCQINRLQQIQNFLARVVVKAPNPVMSHLFLNLPTGLKLMNELPTSCCL